MQEVDFDREQAGVASGGQQLDQLAVVHQPLPDRRGREEVPLVGGDALLHF